jgi:putative CocE/NonD family hydrolase
MSSNARIAPALSRCLALATITFAAITLVAGTFTTVALAQPAPAPDEAPLAPGIVGTPGGGGAWPAVVEVRADLLTHTLYRPAVLPDVPMPVLVWGNGGCSNYGLAHEKFLRHIASNGYLVVALGHAWRQAPPAAADGEVRDATEAAQMEEAMSWALARAADPADELYGHIDADNIALAGHSCGGLQAIKMSADPRVKTSMIFASGVYNRPGGRSRIQVSKDELRNLHAPIAYFTGGPDDIAHENAADDAARIDHVPVFFGWSPVGHGGTFAEENGGAWAQAAVAWLDWQLRGQRNAAAQFQGSDCGLCTDEDWTVERQPPSDYVRSSAYVEVRDGTRLAMNVYRPARAGVALQAPAPVVFLFTPYRARYRTANGSVSELSGRSMGAQALLDAGYVIAEADVRGKGASFGARRGFQDRTEAQDGYDLIQWLAAQPWSNGVVGMMGCSYLGGSTLHVASTAPPALKAIFVGASDIDKFDFVRRGGITAQFNTRPDEPLSDDLMSIPMDADSDGALLREAVAMHAANTPMAALWYSMPFRDSVSPLTGNAFWEEVGPYPYLQTIRDAGIATYFWSNLKDEPTSQMILAAANFDSKLLVGPGSHCVAPPDFNLSAEVLKYFDHHLKGIDNGIDAEPRNTLWVENAPEGQQWIRSDELPGAASRYTSWHADAAGGLGTAAPAEGSTGFSVNYDVGSDEYFAFWVESQEGKGPVFSSAALSEDLHLEGYPVAHLQLSADRSDANVFAYLEEVDAAGKPSVLAMGRLAAGYRALGEAPYKNMGLPFHPGRAADYQPLEPGVPVNLDIALMPVSHIVKAGSRLRLVVTGADPRQRNLQELRQDPPPRLTLHFGGIGGTRIDLPLRQGSSE